MTNISPNEPVFQISVVSRMVGLHQQTIRSYERVGLISPARSRGNTRLYSSADVERLQQVVRLVSDLGVNLAGVDVILLELADGLFQAETAAMLESAFFREVVDGMIFCAGDAMGAACGFDWLRRNEHAVLALAGVLTRSPLQAREAIQATSIPVLSRMELADPITASKLVQEARTHRGAA